MKLTARLSSLCSIPAARRLVSVASCAALVGLGAACSSSSSGDKADAGEFGPSSSSSGSGETHASTKHSAGSSGSKDTSGGKSSSGFKDAGCGAKSPTEDWCLAFAPMEAVTSQVYCEDFDTGQPQDGVLGYSKAIGFGNWVGGNFVSPYCALQASMDAGTPDAGSFSYHAYGTAPGTGGLSMDFDLHVPGGAACTGATVSRIWVSPTGSSSNSGMAWVNITNIMGSGDAATSYTLNLYAAAGNSKVAGPVIVDVLPDARGWARIDLQVVSYSMTATTSTVEAKASWNAAGDTKAAGLSSTPSVNATGALGAGPTTPGVEMDVGIIPDPNTGVPIAGCTVLIDNAVSNIIEPK